MLKGDTKGIAADNPFGYAGFAAYNAYKKNGWKVAIAVGVGLVGGSAFKGGIYTKNGKIVTYWNNG
ncbi:hypothetical protein BWGOE4_16200 [Bacillus mycoides]|uniref:Uncharacterized protein n=1 Tax=Bacillus mycoides TaxID=1405 RepID=A0A1D3MJF3_BACMY|nr:hypothetical protein [Bacillus mycoides]OFD51135.1 hypothetical protein BWGOE3_12180 [Bacillus mycoides]OFD62190.1 hypothetical protein BWGOE6_12520 [Bacillus mycoides]OFD64680.1 hypothetical protein BWGOE4_16200 [Bacillus mycoides]OFD68472.1 hypothetical protein BWGOE7_11370 [Bacillus mycoides]OFD97901.1 hypothetical protein BWGOE11_12660 [Bacillus mycoides]